MIQILGQYLLKDSKLYDGYAQQYLPEPHYPQLVPAIKQQEIIDQLDASIGHEHFYFTIDVKKNAIIHSNGISKWLGYPSSHFSTSKYRSIIHPCHALAQELYSTALFELLSQGQIAVQFMQPICAALVACKQKNGTYVYLKRKCTPFQLDNEGRMTVYLSVFSIIKEFTNEDFSLRIYNSDGPLAGPMEKIKGVIQQKFKANGFFSVQELRILKRYANSNNTREEIAQSFGIKKTTVDTHNGKMLKKGENIFHQKFDNAKSLADYLQRLQFI